MGISLGSLGYFGAGFTRQQMLQQQQEEQEKQRRQQGLQHFLQLGQLQREREAEAARLYALRAKATGEGGAARLKQAGEKADADRKLRGLSEFPRAIGAVPQANQPDYTRQYNTAAGTNFAVPGDMTGTLENRNYGLPESVAAPVRQTLAQVLGSVAPGAGMAATMKPETVPYYGLDTKDAVTTGEKAQADQARIGETAGNHRLTLKETIRNHDLQHGDRDRGQDFSSSDRQRSQNLGHEDRLRGQDLSSTDRLRAQDLGHTDRVRGQDLSHEDRQQGIAMRGGNDPAALLDKQIEATRKRMTGLSQNSGAGGMNPPAKTTPEGAQEYAGLQNHLNRLMNQRQHVATGGGGDSAHMGTGGSAGMVVIGGRRATAKQWADELARRKAEATRSGR